MYTHVHLCIACIVLLGESGSECFYQGITNFSLECMDSQELVVSPCHTKIRVTDWDRGIALCTGRHCCLWCLITQSDLKIPLEKRGRFPERSVQSLREDNHRFTESGGNLKHAKLFNNCIGEPLFNISLEKVWWQTRHCLVNAFISHGTVVLCI